MCEQIPFFKKKLQVVWTNWIDRAAGRSKQQPPARHTPRGACTISNLRRGGNLASRRCSHRRASSILPCLRPARWAPQRRSTTVRRRRPAAASPRERRRHCSIASTARPPQPPSPSSSSSSWSVQSTPQKAGLYIFNLLARVVADKQQVSMLTAS